MKSSLWLASTLVSLLLSCDGILSVNDPDTITVDDLSGESGIDALYAGAHAAYARVLYFAIIDGGTLSDEFRHSGRHFWREEYDRRMSLGGDFAALQEHRAYLEFASDEVRRIARSNEPEPRIATIDAFAALTYITFAELYCSGVPFGRLRASGEPEPAAPHTTDETLQTALARLDAAATSIGTQTDVENLIAVARGRALLNLGSYGEAAAAVANVSDDFEFVVEHSSDVTNDVHFFTHRLLEVSVSDSEGVNGLPYRSANDPRVPWEDRGETGRDQTTEHFRQLIYPTPESPIIVAGGIEARLIEAESRLLANDATWLDVLNRLRAGISLAALADPGSLDGRVDLLFRERAFWLYATAHRLGDMRRLVRQYGRDAEFVFPAGPYHRSGMYGTGVYFPIPDAEVRLNDASEGCLTTGA